MTVFNFKNHCMCSLMLGLLTLLTACGGGGGGNTTNPDSGASLSRIEVTPSLPSLANGTSLSLTATGIYSDNSKRSISSEVSWSSNDTNVATISSSGVISTQAAGQITAQASLTGITGSTNITVTGAELIRIDISPTSPTLPLGTTLTLSALGQFSDGSNQDLSTQINWSSSTAAVIVDASGLLTPQSLGNSTVTASLTGVSSSQTVSVNTAVLTRIEISAPSTSLPVGEQQILKALGHYSDGSLQDITEQVTWQNSPMDALAISTASGSEGLATALIADSITISATLGSISGAFEITTTAATLDSIDISPPNAQLAANTLMNFLAMGHYSDGSIQDLSDSVSWATADTAIASIGNASGDEGQAYGLSTGSTTVSATLDDVSGNATLTVSAAQLLSISVLPTELTLAIGTQQSLSAIGNFSDGSVQPINDQVIWASDTTAASVTDGEVSALQPGSARISARLNGVSGNARITVTNATLSSLQISPASATLAVGTSTQLQASALYSDGSLVDVTTNVVWGSADDGILRVENSSGQQGRLTALAAGSVVITAGLNGTSDNISVSVNTASLTALRIVNPANANLDSAEQLQLMAIGDFSDGSSQDLSADSVWNSDQHTLATVSNKTTEQGLVKAGIRVSGVAVITASYGGYTPSLNLTVNNTLQRPVSLVVLATPNVILNDGSDSSTVEIRVQAADPTSSIADGTVIDLQISLAGSPVDTQSLATSNGIARYVFSTIQVGLLQLQATVNGTAITNKGSLQSTTNTFGVIVGEGFSDAQTDGSNIFSGGRFGFFLYNLSNRDFPLTKFELRNGSDILFSTTDPDALNGNVLSGGLKTGLIFTLSIDIVDQGVEARYTVTDPITGNPGIASVIFTSP